LSWERALFLAVSSAMKSFSAAHLLRAVIFQQRSPVFDLIAALGQSDL